MTPTTFRGPDVCRITGLTYRQLDYQCRTGLLVASVAQARGSGSQRLFSLEDVVRAALAAELLALGVVHENAKQACDAVARDDARYLVVRRGGAPRPGGYVQAGALATCSTPKEVMAAIDRAGTVLVVDIDRVRGRVELKIERMRRAS